MVDKARIRTHEEHVNGKGKKNRWSRAVRQQLKINGTFHEMSLNIKL